MQKAMRWLNAETRCLGGKPTLRKEVGEDDVLFALERPVFGSHNSKCRNQPAALVTCNQVIRLIIVFVDSLTTQLSGVYPTPEGEGLLELDGIRDFEYQPLKQRCPPSSAEPSQPEKSPGGLYLDISDES